MPTVYPGALDSFVNPVDTDTLNAPPHDGQHADVNDAVEAVEAELGLDPRGTFATVRARLDDLGVWGPWTPTLTGITKGAGVVVARFSRDGNTVDAFFELTFAADTTIDITGPSISTPVTLASHYTDNLNWLGEAYLIDTGADNFVGVVRGSANNFQVMVSNTAGTYIRQEEIGPTVPMTWAVGDILTFGVRYEAAP